MKIHFITLCIFAFLSSCNKSSPKTESVISNSPPESITPKNFPIKIFKTLALSPINISYSPHATTQDLLNQSTFIDSEKKINLENFLNTSEKTERNEFIRYYQSSWSKDKKQGFDSKGIENWIEKNNCGKASNPINDQLTPSNNILISQICFKSVWQTPFSIEDSKLAQFQSSPHATHTVKFMKAINHYRYFESENSKWIELGFEKSPLVLVLGLPKNRFEITKTENELSTKFVSSLNSKLKEERVSIAIPRFSISSTINLRNTLSQGGLDFIFNKNSYKKNSKKFKSFPEEIFQISNLKIDEQGVNLVENNFAPVKRSSGIRLLAKQFYADQPFVLILQNRITNDLQMIGRVYQP